MSDAPFDSAPAMPGTPDVPETLDGVPETLDGGADRPASARVRRIAAVVLPVVLVLGALGGAAFHVNSTVDKADTTVKTESWAENAATGGADPAGGAHKGRHDNALSKLLLPVPGGFVLGPDLDENGNDSHQTGKQATAQLKASGKGLTGKARRDWEKRVDKFGVQGTAGRSYSGSNLLAEVTVSTMKDRKALREMHTFSTGLFDDLPGVTKGPKIEGHAGTKCFLSKSEEKDGIDSMFCSAYEKDVLVSFALSGGRPLNKSDAADFVKKQLDHIDSPGEYV
ncbi:hypothetical protein [Streptomyces sp. N35]|uniref:hypothetical protein n=1 Tax=Streptomyces sp. N35 TaxID=2795730 RepID=UPI0018F5FB3D|nr:hypothetical protein [Streptomyces sp. N35]